MLPPVLPYDTAGLFRDYAVDVGRWAARLTGSPGDADDIVQEVFMTVFRQGTTIAAIHSPPAWLMQITRNVVRHAWRSRQRSAARTAAYDLDKVVAPGPDPHEALERRRATEQLNAALNALDERAREICWLSDIEGLPPTTVAAMTGLQPATLRVRRFRARRQLARHLTAGSRPRVA